MKVKSQTLTLICQGQLYYITLLLSRTYDSAKIYKVTTFAFAFEFLPFAFFVMFYFYKLYFRDLWVSAPLLSVILIQIFLWGYLFFNIRPDAGQIFLHYSIIFGVDLVGDWWKIYYLPLVGVLVVLFNYFFSGLLYSVDKFLARLLSFWVLFFHLFLMAGTILLVRLNI